MLGNMTYLLFDIATNTHMLRIYYVNTYDRDTDLCNLDRLLRNFLSDSSISVDFLSRIVYHYCTVIVEEYDVSASIVWNEV